MIRFLFLVLTMSLFSGSTHAQSLKQQFYDLLTARDTLGQEKVLKQWQSKDTKDPELFVAYFNYYVLKSKRDVQVSENVSPYDPLILAKGFEWIKKGINKNPDRLDMRFGLIYMLGQSYDYQPFTEEVLKVIERSDKIKNAWAWTDSKPLEDPQNFMLSAIQDYQLELYNTGNDDLLPNMVQIANVILKYYPDHFESWSNLGIAYSLQKDYDKALVHLLHAQNLNSRDFVVLYHIAEAYKSKGDKQNAIKYYELVKENGDEEAKNVAQTEIDKLLQN